VLPPFPLKPKHLAFSLLRSLVLCLWVQVTLAATLGETAALGAGTLSADMMAAVMATAVTVEVTAAVKTGLRRLRHAAAITEVGTGAATVGVATATMVGNFWIKAGYKNRFLLSAAGERAIGRYPQIPCPA
jgi:hypothetical protein